jgi:hypothetical protein
MSFFVSSRRVLRNPGRAAVSVYSPIERTPGANACVISLDEVLGAHASRIKRGEHAFADPAQLKTLLQAAGFGAVDVQTVVQTISFPSVLDYVRFQLVATPMTVLLANRTEPERQAIISSVASKATTLCTPAMLDGGGFTFAQEAYVAVARNAWCGYRYGRAIRSTITLSQTVKWFGLPGWREGFA